ncbi:MAG: hypothetical protein H8D45_05675 [Bacteroidetes bacterium]|nr:hypothetical protein [Bacteroidota bacterium]
MTTVIINNKTKKGKLILDLIREMGCGEIITDNPNEETRAAIKDARRGKLKRANSAAGLCKELGI